MLAASSVADSCHDEKARCMVALPVAGDRGHKRRRGAWLHSLWLDTDADQGAVQGCTPRASFCSVLVGLCMAARPSEHCKFLPASFLNWLLMLTARCAIITFSITRFGGCRPRAHRKSEYPMANAALAVLSARQCPYSYWQQLVGSRLVHTCHRIDAMTSSSSEWDYPDDLLGWSRILEAP